MSKIITREAVQKLSMPDNVRIGLMVSEHRKKCAQINCDFDYFGLAFGQSPFFVPQIMQEALAKHADKGHYASSIGIKELRNAISRFNQKYFDLEIDPDQIVIGNGTKDVIYTVMSMIESTIVIPSPSWIGYRPQAKLLEKDFYIYHLKPEHSYRIQPDDLDVFFRKLNKEPVTLILNNPHNPTGVVYSEKELRAITEVCKKHNALVIADEIYALSTYDHKKFVSMRKVYPEGSFVTNGISKDRSCGGWRFGYCILPDCCDNQFKSDFAKVTATYYTNVSTPTQYACVEAYLPNDEIKEYFKITRNIHRIIGTFLSEEFNKVEGIKATIPEGGFYFYADFNELREVLKKRGVKTSNDLANSLIDHPYHIAVVTGDANMIEPDNFSARIAFVDYDGKSVFNTYKKNPPQSHKEEIEFIKSNAPRIYEVRNVLESWVNSLKNDFISTCVA